jgi:putative polyketide hydroxylase
VTQKPDLEVPILIVGGSLVGMSAALLLGHHGVRALVVEYHRGTAIHPRAAQCTQRTMEIFRTLGIEDIVMAKSEAQFVQDAGVVAVETLIGGVTQNFIANLNEGIRDVSPSVRVFLSQDALEPVLKEHAERLGADIRFSTECVSLAEDADGVTAVICHRDSGETKTVRARYVIAADGAHSRVRERLGIGMRGHGSFSNSVTIYFRADLRSILEGKLWAVVYANHPRLRGFFRFEKPFKSAFLVVNTLGDAGHPDRDVSTGITDEGLVGLVHTALGSEDIPVTVDNVMRWKATADVAEHMQTGHIFIAGDAAHVMPPTGGFGGNTGVQDAQNLAWKLALVLRGVAGPKLLATYEQERRPVGVFTVEQAYTRYVLRTDAALDRTNMQPLANELNVETGYVYHSPAVVEEIPGDSTRDMSPRESKARPGTRAPHLWLERDSKRISTLDLYRGNFTLVAADRGGAWEKCAAEAARRARVELDAHRIGASGLEDPSGGFAEAHGVEPTGCVLVRPDGFVAWRARNDLGASAGRLNEVLDAVLCRDS